MKVLDLEYEPRATIPYRNVAAGNRGVTSEVLGVHFGRTATLPPSLDAIAMMSDLQGLGLPTDTADRVLSRQQLGEVVAEMLPEIVTSHGITLHFPRISM